MNSTNEPGEFKAKADDNGIAIGEMNIGGNVSGNITIGHNIGYTAEQVSTLIAQIKSTFQPIPFDGRCPYKGLDYFEEQDAELFFGREHSVEDLVSRVKVSRTVFVTGPSGSGKSSLVRAGLIHALKSGTIKDSRSDRWLYGTIRPGRNPLEALKNVLSRLKSPELGNYFLQNVSKPDVLNECVESALSESTDQRLVLFIDQFEEVFTQLSREDERVTFLNLLTNAAAVEEGRMILLFAMRSDFVSNCAVYPKLNALLNNQFVQIGAMQPDELVSAIAQPALRVGLRIDPDLIAQIINDMQGEPGTLPLMQFALKDLFDSQQSDGGVIALTLKDYFQHGGIHKSLERHADNTFAGFDAEEQELARSIFTGLIEIGRGTQDTRRTANFDELVPTSTTTNEIVPIVRKLADARLITTDEIAGKDTVTISHEKLIEAWPWLKRLVHDNREVIALQNEIAEDAEEWEEHGRDSSYLYSGGRLANVREQINNRKIRLGQLGEQFIRAGQTKRRRVQVLIFTSVTLVLIASITAAIVFRVQAQISRAGDLAGQAIALRDKNFFASLLVSIEAFNLDDNPQTRRVLLDNSQSNSVLRQFLPMHQAEVFSVAFSPDGKILASTSRDKSIILWDVESRQPIDPPLIGHSGSVVSVDFSPDGTFLASGSTDKTIILWDVASHRPVGNPFTSDAGRVYSVAFSPDGRVLASGNEDGTITLWDVESRTLISSPLVGHEKTVTTIDFSPDGRFLASGGTDSKVIIWDLQSTSAVAQHLLGHQNAITSLAFSPDGKTLASGSADQTIILWDTVERRPIDQPLVGQAGYITSLAFNPSGGTLISGSVDRSIILWDMESHRPIHEPLTGHSHWVRSVAFSPDGKTIASGGSDNMVVLWRLDSQSPISQKLSGHKRAVYSVAMSPNGEVIASGGEDGTILLWDSKTGQPFAPPLVGDNGTINSIAFSPDGKILASGNNDNTISLWDVENQQTLPQPLVGHEKAVYSVAFSPDGRILASGSADKTIVLWDMESLKPIDTLTGHDGAVNSLTFSPDGTILASGSEDAKVILWDLANRQIIDPPLLGHEGVVYSLTFSPNGKVLASGSADYKIILWKVETHQPIKAPLTYQSGFIYSVAFSPNGKILASGSYQNSIQLWNVENIESPSPFGEPFVDNKQTITSLAFSPDGRALVSGSSDTSVILWNLDPQNWITRICQRAGRNFSQDEWIRFFPSEEYRTTCPQPQP